MTSASTEPMIEARGLTRRFGDLVAVQGVDLRVEPGEVFGLLGPNGAGKTTTVRMLAALIAPSSGSARVAGHVIGQDNQAVRGAIGILTETPGLYSSLDAEENLRLFARLHGLVEIRKPIERYLRMLDLWDRRHEPVGGFSKGMRQKLAIARALIHEPQVVFLDEPTSGLDPVSAKVVRDFIAQMKAEGRTIVLCTHNLDEADRLCDRIALIKRAVVRVDTPEGLRRGLYGRTVRFRLREATPALLAAVEAVAAVERAEIQGAVVVASLADPERDNPAIVRALVEAGAEILFVEEEKQSLERVYFDLLDTPKAPEAP